MNIQMKKYPLTHPQKRIWYTEQIHPGTSISNIAGTLKIKGKIDYALLEKALNIFVEKNDSVRLRLTVQDDEPMQYISQYQYKKLEFLDFSDKTLDQLYEWDNAQARTPFKLYDSDLFQFTLIKLGDNEGGYFAKMHHIISDAWSMVQFTNQVIEYYKKLISEEAVEMDKLPSYIEFVYNESEYKNSERFISDKKFWNDRFETIPDLTTLAVKRSSSLNTKAKRKTFILTPELTSQIRKFSRDNNTSVFSVFLSVLSIYVNRIMNKKDMVFGTPVLNRSNAREKATAGMFVSTVPIRINLDENLSFKEFVHFISREWLQILRHQKYPYDILLKDIREKYKHVDKLYDIILSYQNAKFIKDQYIGKHEGRWHFNGYQVDSLCIHINDREDEGNLIIDYDFLTQYFSVKAIEYIHHHLMNVLQFAMKKPETKLCRLEILSSEEKNRILNTFNATYMEYPREKAFHQLFEEQAEKTPENTALVFEDKRLTYRELNARANQLARLLKDNGICRDSIVGLSVNRSLEMVIGILAILKAGGAYLPIDPQYPDERVKYMLKDSGAKILLTGENSLAGTSFDGKCVDIFDSAAYLGEGSNLEHTGRGDDLAYIIYTSGSTGAPKGVMLKHSSLVNLAGGLSRFVPFYPGKTSVSITTFSFDIFIFEALLPLLKGARVVIANEEQQKIPNLLGELINAYEVDVIQTTPSRMQMLITDAECRQSFRRLSEIVLGGEPFPRILLERLREITSARIFNGYGPTESTVYSTFKDVTDSKDVDIGKPISNTRVYILDANANLVPIGVPGELCIGGDGLGRGYINREQLNKERFIPDPFAPGELLYRTGDLARWFPKGDIEYLGRIDQQVKIRGLRIELGEIENQLLKHPLVEEAVVIDKEDQEGRKFLCAYIICREDVPVHELRDYLGKFLPSYMVPSYFMRVDEIPLSPNGKVDRRQLPAPEITIQSSNEYVEPQSEIEKKLAQLWSGVLKIGKVGILDNFFELGGDSLSLITLISAVYKEFNVQLSITEIYKLPTIREMGRIIENTERNSGLILQPVAKSGCYPLSLFQKGIYMLMQMETESLAYNMPGAVLIKGGIDRDRLLNAFKQLIERHESLRTSFGISSAGLVQYVHEEAEFEISQVKLQKKELEAFIRNFTRPFDLKKAPLIRVALAELPDNEYAVVFDMHHIMSDGASLHILFRDLAALYEGKLLPELKIQYKDYSVWQNKTINTPGYRKQEKYWMNVFNGEIPVLEMPLDYSRPAVKSFEGMRQGFALNKALTKRLKRYALETGTTLYMVLLAAFNVLLYRYTEQEDIVVGTPISVRSNPVLDNVLGMFVNTLPMRNHPSGDKSFRDFLHEVKENALEAYENKDFPFEELVSKLKVERDPSRNPLFDVMFVLQNMDMEFAKFGGAPAKPYNIRSTVAKFDLTIEVMDEDENIVFDIEYCKALFNPGTIVQLADHYINILKHIVKNPDVKLSDIKMLSDREKEKVVNKFNANYADIAFDKPVHCLFEEQAEKAPDRTALVFEGRSISYGELNAKANRLAEVLGSSGIGRNDVVALMVHRSFDMIIAMLAVLKSGAAYLPIDPEFPAARIEYMLEDSGARLLITEEGLRTKARFGGIILTVDSGVDTGNSANPANITLADDSAYIIYTSGSTGKPKGVVIPHRAVYSFIRAATARIAYGTKTILSKTTYCFDVFVLESLLPLANGLRVIIANEEEQRSARLLNDLIIEYKVGIIHSTPSRLQLMLDDEKCGESFALLTEIITGGETLSGGLLKRLVSVTHARIYNVYGPTETTVFSTLADVTGEESVSIGKPISNTRIYIMDKNLNPMPLGIPGELHIGGSGLAKEYMNRLELTRGKFLPDPFIAGERIYKTGDRGKWLPDGNIAFIGRKDNQIKIRGLRIELGEIENALVSYGSVKEAVAAYRSDSGGRYQLCAYLTFKPGSNASVAELRRFLSGIIPEYMIPSYFHVMENIPVTANGKVDMSRLPEPGQGLETVCDYKPPENDVEKKMVNAWADVLKISAGCISVNSDFFELGGDSLSAIMVQTKTLNYGWNLKIQDFYKYRTISRLAEKIINAGNDETEEIRISAYRQVPRHKASEEIAAYRIGSRAAVLLTGATGFLGIHILNSLMEKTSSDIYCLVRGESLDSAQKRLTGLLDFYFPGRYDAAAADRIKVINGDVTLDKFGLESHDYEQLAGKVDYIIHTAAIVKHYGPYPLFEKVNVQGTGNVIKFAYENRIGMLHTSTMSVSGNMVAKQEKLFKSTFTENDFYIGQSFSDNVYVRSKFEAEELIYRYVDKGLNAAVCRVGNLTGRYGDGHFQANIAENAFYNVLKSIISLGAVSRDMQTYPMEFTPVDCCSDAIVSLVSGGITERGVFHLYNHNAIGLYQLVQYLNEMDIKISFMDNLAFAEFVKEISNDTEKLGLLSGLIQKFSVADNNTDKTDLIIDSSYTVEVLKRFAFEWPEIDEPYIKKIVGYMQNTGFLR